MVNFVDEKFKLNEKRTLALIKAIVELGIIDVKEFLLINGIEFEDFLIQLRNVEEKYKDINIECINTFLNIPSSYVDYVSSCLKSSDLNVSTRRKNR